MPHHGVTATTLILALGAGSLTGCSAATTRQPQTSARVVQPGAPGDEPRVTDSIAPRDTGSSPSEREMAYIVRMIPHHQQALEMTALAPRRAQHRQVRALAERIGGAQRPEIAAMRGWLATEAPHAEHQHTGAMPGMATPEQLARLRAARGAEFDALFLRLMIRHHEGAVRMATDLLRQGRDERLHEMAQDVLVTQRDEIGIMRRLRDDIAR